ncbi:tetratricopeptide repeat protein [Aurantiacibacter poecillastricola]|uniref:tetratricopeptide repeat protein n=1 Tax=Aurantiacibacter poecillastricola TaxID=3064385 RepID=UPI00273EC3EB|nr:tetratricopeptide repeat protein [Aurantiacibacter sp. 219JJ12-13]MDP5262718.1 cytochrome C biosynthesis protein [Aurantiacibacter sp. 219JJ12-13]
MTWIAVILLALVAFAVAILLFRLRRGLWTGLAAVLVFGLAGYALQASPNLPSAPKSAGEDDSEQLFDIAEVRREFVAQGARSGSDFMVVSDAMARRGRYADAARMLEGVTRADPEDFEAWLAQGIALTQHAEGQLTQAALYAFQRAAQLRPDNLAPGYFLGASFVQQGRLLEAQQMWSETLANAPDDAEGRDRLAFSLERLNGMLQMMQAGRQPTMSPQPQPPQTPVPQANVPSENGE